MASLPIRWISARALCHATEEEPRVAQALDAAVSGGEGSRHSVEGQHGNPVLILSRRIEKASDIRATWGRWSDAGLLTALEKDLRQRLDADGVLHLRIDKQKAYRGILAPAGDADTIDLQVKIRAYPANPEEILRVARLLVEGAA